MSQYSKSGAASIAELTKKAKDVADEAIRETEEVEESEEIEKAEEIGKIGETDETGAPGETGETGETETGGDVPEAPPFETVPEASEEPEEGEEAAEGGEGKKAAEAEAPVPEESAPFADDGAGSGAAETASGAPKPYHERCYLYYGGKEVPQTLDVNGTLAFLTEKLKCDGGELYKARRGKDGSELIREAADENCERCSYCGVPITGVDFHRLKDGRNRCTVCSRSLVKSEEELQKIFDSVKSNMEMFFGISFGVPVAVEMVDERTLKRKIRHAIKAPDDKSLILGVAVDSKGSYTVYLENGAPRISVISTTVHEMTHIWQYTHWNRKALLAKYGKKGLLEVYEGMAKWTEIQYLYLMGERGVAAREEFITSLRKDEYGRGFLRYLSAYRLSTEPMTFGDTPFMAPNDPFGNV